MIFLGMALLTLLIVIAVLVRIRVRLHEQSMMIPSYRHTLRQRESRTKDMASKVISFIQSFGLGKASWSLPVLGAAVGAVMGHVGFRSWRIGALVGLFAPFLVSLWVQRYLEREYSEQVKETMRFLESTFSSGGQLEEVLPELLKRTQGRMHREVEVAFALQRNGTPMRDILIHWHRMTASPHFAFAIKSLADVLKDAGDLVTVMSESIAELQRDEQFRDALQVVTHSSWTMLLVTLAFPIMTFLMFHQVAITELHEMPWLTGVLFAGVLGILGILYWFRQVSRV